MGTSKWGSAEEPDDRVVEDDPCADGDDDDALAFLVFAFSDDVVSALAALGTICMKMGKCPTEIP